MKEGGLDAAFFVVPVEQGERTQEGYASARESAALAIDRIRRATEENSHTIGLALSSGDAYRLEKEGKLAAFIGLGNGYAIGTDLSLIESYHAKGVRSLTLCGDADNEICDSATDRTHPGDSGLSGFGRQVVMECNRVGMIIDVFHCSEKSFFDVLAVSRAPVIVSHSAARVLCDRPENMTDAMIRALAEKGGVILICFIPERLVQPKIKARASIQDIVDHIDHVTRLAGVEGVGIGSAFDGGGGVSGCGDVGEMLNLTIELLRRGYGENAVEAIWGGNVMRVFKQVTLLAEKE
jgi:membrane dipeptidase